jgi:ABC-type nitrate/sulfonate/bicarbonate transport system ATPase subunit
MESAERPLSVEPWLVWEDLSFSWGGAVLFDAVSLTISARPCLWLMGSSGIGKSTFLRIAAGYQRPDRGRCLIFGQEVRGPGRDRVLSFQDHKLFPWMRVEDNIGFTLKLARWTEADIRSRIDRLLEAADLTNAARLWPRQLSGGMSQRVAVLRALAPRPRCILLDEPFSALDADNATRMMRLITAELEENRSTAVIASHNLTLMRDKSEPAIIFAHEKGRTQIRCAF